MRRILLTAAAGAMLAACGTPADRRGAGESRQMEDFMSSIRGADGISK